MEKSSLTSNQILNLSFNRQLLDYKFRRDIAIKRLAVYPSHPYSAIPTPSSEKLVYKDIRSNADAFYKSNYNVDDFLIILVGRLGKPGDTSTPKEKQDHALKMITQAMERSIPKIKKKNKAMDLQNPSLPFSELPSFLALQADEEDTLVVKFQVKSDFATEAKYESLLFIKFALNKLIRERLHQLSFMDYLEIPVYYHSSFCLLNIRLHLNDAAKGNVGKVVKNIFGAVKHLKSVNLKEVYQNFKDELDLIYNSKPLMTSEDIAITMAERALNFGFKEIFRATETLNNFSESHILDLLNQMLLPSNWMIVMSSDFPTKSSTSSPNLSLSSALSTFASKRYDLSNKRTIQGSVSLDKRFRDLKFDYHYQKISPSDQKFLMDDGQSNSLFSFGTNPYVVSKDSFKKTNSNSKDDSVQVAPKAENFDAQLNSIGNTNCFFYRTNRMFVFPMVYVTLRFSLQSVNKSFKEFTINHAQKLLLIKSIWKRRLRLIQNYLREYNGDLNLKYIHNSIKLYIFAPKTAIFSAIYDVLEQLSLSNISQQEIQEAQIRIIKHSTFDYFRLKDASRQAANFIVKGKYMKADLANNLRKNLYKITAAEVKPLIIFGFMEGDIDKEDAEKLFTAIKAKFAM